MKWWVSVFVTVRTGTFSRLGS